MRQLICAALLMIFLSVGCTGDRSQQDGITLATAQRFHAFIKDVGPQNGFECQMSGFPVWRTRGLEPSVGPVGEWMFSTPSDPHGDGKQDLSQVVLVIRLVPSADKNRKARVCSWQGHDVMVVRKTPFKREKGSAESLIAALKELNAKANKPDARDGL